MVLQVYFGPGPFVFAGTMNLLCVGCCTGPLCVIRKCTTSQVNKLPESNN